MIDLKCGNCLDYLKDISNESIDLLITDPPYRITPKGSNGSAGGMMTKSIIRSGQVFEDNDISPKEYAYEFFRILKDGSHCYIMTNQVNLQDMLNTFTNAGFNFTKSLIWNKCNKIVGRFYMSQFEYILFFHKGYGKQIKECGTSDLLTFPNIKLKKADGTNYHDTEKPVDLMKVLIRNSSDENDLVMDPFMGIGSTGIACAMLNRNFIGYEINKEYFDFASKRINGTKKIEIIKKGSLF